jgi:hypothetical protein
MKLMEEKWLMHIASAQLVEMMELIEYETWHSLKWLGGGRSRRGLPAKDQVAGMKGKLWCSMSMNWGNGEEQARLWLMDQWGHVKLWSGSYHSWRSSQNLMCVDDQVAWMMEVGCLCGITNMEIKWCEQGSSIIVRHFISPLNGWIEKCLTRSSIDSRTIKRGKLVCIMVI